MNFYHFFLLTAAALLACCDTATGVDTIKTSAVTSSTTFVQGHTTNTEQRSLRAEEPADEENDNSEDRANLWKKVTLPLKLKLWLRAGKSDDFVKAALGMKTLSGDALKAHPNYKTFLNFQLKKWYKTEKLTTYDAWVRLQMNGFPASRGDGYNAYIRYVNIFNDNAIQALKAHRETPALVSSHASKGRDVGESDDLGSCWKIRRLCFDSAGDARFISTRTFTPPELRYLRGFCADENGGNVTEG